MTYDEVVGSLHSAPATEGKQRDRVIASRRLFALEGNRQSLDGGAMFGNVPKALWSRWMVPDAENRVTLSCRCLLIRQPNAWPRTILLETGIGAFFEPKLKQRYGVVETEHKLIEALAAEGLAPEDVDVIVLSHLHFDHAGGLLAAHTDGTLRLAFPRATVVVGKQAWERGLHPHLRDRASFIPGLGELLLQSGRLLLLDPPDAERVLGPGFAFHSSEGHTPGLLLTEVATVAGPLMFASDLIPGGPWVHLPVTMGYDRNAEQLIDEKQQLLGDLAARGGYLFFTHDPGMAVGQVVHDAQTGRYSARACELTALMGPVAS